MILRYAFAILLSPLTLRLFADFACYIIFAMLFRCFFHAARLRFFCQMPVFAIFFADIFAADASFVSSLFAAFFFDFHAADIEGYAAATLRYATGCYYADAELFIRYC